MNYINNTPEVLPRELRQLVTTTEMLQQQKQADIIQSKIMGELS